MFDESPTWNRFRGEDKTKIIRVQLGYVPDLEETTPEERFARRLAVTLAFLFSAGLLMLQLPELVAEPQPVSGDRPVYVVQQVRFSPPPAPRQQQIPKRKEKRRVIPVPDPTPDEPEPLRTLEVELPDFQSVETGDVFGIPNAAPAHGPIGPAPLRVGGDITPPRKVHYPAPGYTEEARRAQIQGVVILEAIVDARGNVADVKVLKGLPMGLSESAVETALEWRFEPAERQGIPVPVIFNLTISFSLQ